MESIYSREKLLNLLNDEANYIKFLKEEKLIKPDRVCLKCNKEMQLKYTKNTLDKYQWVCNNKNCKSKISIKNDSLFYQFRLPIKKIIKIIFEFSKFTPIKEVCNEFNLSQKTVSKLFIFCQDLIDFYFQENPIEKLGGSFKWVEIDETCVFKRKYNQGRLKNQIWLFGGIERGTNGTNCFIKYVVDRTKVTLEREILENIYCESVIVSDCWKSYDNIQNLGFIHFKVNHSKNFVDPFITEIHTQSIESLWGKLKKFLKKRNITKRERIEKHIQEFIFRQKKKMFLLNY